MNVIVSVLAEEDLSHLLSYITNDLSNPIAANNLADKILHILQKLSEFPDIGPGLKTIAGKLGNYRYLIVDNYLIIYRVADQEIYVVRILYARSEYVKLLQG